MTLTDTVHKLLDKIHRDGIAKVGVEDYVAVNRILKIRPDLAEPRARRELINTIGALLATNQEQSKKIRNLAETRFFRKETAEEDKPEDPENPDQTSPDRPEEEVVHSSWMKIRRYIADLPIWFHGAALTIAIVSALIWLIYAEVEKEPVQESNPEATGPAPIPKNLIQKWEKEPLEETHLNHTLDVQSKPRDFSDQDWHILLIGALLIVVGVWWISLPWYIRKQRKKQAEADKIAGQDRRENLSLEAEEKNVSRRLVYHVNIVPPMRDVAATDSATVLGRLFGHVESRNLDIERTVEATTARGGEIVPVKAQQRISRKLTVLVDVESGAHPWLKDIDWLLSRWKTLGVDFRRFDFKFDPMWLNDDSLGLMTSFEELSRRVDGEPLLIISRKLTTKAYSGDAAWLRYAKVWPTRAWLDPSPTPPDELPGAFIAEIDRFANLGFARFPLTEPGLMSLANYLISQGQAYSVPDWPTLPALEDPAAQAALKTWALFSSLVPDPTWDQLQANRDKLPEVRQLFPENRHLQRLIDWIESRTQKNAETGDGITLEIPKPLSDELLADVRITDKELPEAERLEPRLRQMLKDQLDATAPENPLMRQFWNLTRMRHELVLDPENAMKTMGALMSGPWHEEVLEVVGDELNRKEAAPKMSRATRSGLQTAIDPESRLAKLSDLLYPPRSVVGLGVAATILLLISGWQGLSNIPELNRTLFSFSYNFDAVLPIDYRLVEQTIPPPPISPQLTERARGWQRLGPDAHWLIQLTRGTMWLTSIKLGNANILGFPERSDGHFFQVSANGTVYKVEDIKEKKSTVVSLEYPKRQINSSEEAPISIVKFELIEDTLKNYFKPPWRITYSARNGGNTHIRHDNWPQGSRLRFYLDAAGWFDAFNDDREDYTVYSHQVPDYAPN